MPGPENITPGRAAGSVVAYASTRQMWLLAIMAASLDVEIVLTANLVPITCRHFTGSAFIISAIIATKRFFGALIQPWASWKSDYALTRFGRRRPFILIGLPMAALSLLAFGLLPELIQNDSARHSWYALGVILLINSVLQIGVDLNWGVLEPYYADSFRPEQLGRAASLRQVTSKSLILVMVTVVLGWADKSELLPYLFGAVVFVVAFLIALFGLRERTLPERTQPSAYKPIAHFALLFRDLDYIKLAAVCAGTLVLPAAISLLTPLYVTETLGFSIRNLGQVQVLGVVLSILLAFPAGWLADYYGAKYIMAGGFVLYAAAAAGLAYCTSSYLTLCIWMTLFGAAQVVALTPMTAMVFQYCAPGERGTVYGLIQFCRAFSSFLVLLALGYLVQFVVSDEPTPFRAQDIVDVAAVARRLNAGDNPAVRAIDDRLSPEAQRLLRQPSADPATLRASLIHDFNALAQDPAIYSQERFAGVALSRQSRRLLAEVKLGDGDRFVLNRTLIQDIFPKAIARKVNYRVPYIVSIGLAILSALIALTTRRGKYSRTLRPDSAVPAAA